MSQEIVIRITIPDGASLVSDAGGSRPFVERPTPPKPSGVCPIHAETWKLIPAGVSKKSGRRYNAFYVCPENGCDEKPSREEEEGQDIPW